MREQEVTAQNVADDAGGQVSNRGPVTTRTSTCPRIGAVEPVESVIVMVLPKVLEARAQCELQAGDKAAALALRNTMLGQRR